MSEIDKASLVREVAEKSKIILDENDPIFALAEINGILMRKYSESLDVMIKSVSATIGNSTSRSAELMEAAAKDAAVKTIHSFQKVISDITQDLARIHGEHLEKIAELGKIVESNEKGYLNYLQFGLVGVVCLLQLLVIYLLLKT